jgi:hypothetical protein
MTLLELLSFAVLESSLMNQITPMTCFVFCQLGCIQALHWIQFHIAGLQKADDEKSVGYLRSDIYTEITSRSDRSILA